MGRALAGLLCAGGRCLTIAPPELLASSHRFARRFGDVIGLLHVDGGVRRKVIQPHVRGGRGWDSGFQRGGSASAGLFWVFERWMWGFSDFEKENPKIVKLNEKEL